MHSPNASGASADDVDADGVDESVASVDEQAAAEPITAKAASPQKVVRRSVCFMAMTV